MTLRTWVLTLQSSCHPHWISLPKRSLPAWGQIHSRTSPFPHTVAFLTHLGSKTTLQVAPTCGDLPHLVFLCQAAVLIHFHRCTPVWVPSSAFLGFNSPYQFPLHGSDPSQALTPLSLIIDTLLTLLGLCCPMPAAPLWGTFLSWLWLSALGIPHPAWASACCLGAPHGWVPPLPSVTSDTSC